MGDYRWTPGPWVVEDGPSSRNYTINSLAIDGELVADTIRRFGQDQLANAHLIAAAPDLYEALDRLLGDISGEGDYTGRRPEYAHAALAKARGEQP